MKTKSRIISDLLRNKRYKLQVKLQEGTSGPTKWPNKTFKKSYKYQEWFYSFKYLTSNNALCSDIIPWHRQWTLKYHWTFQIQFGRWFLSKQQPEWVTKWLQEIAAWLMISWAKKLLSVIIHNFNIKAYIGN